MFGFGKKKKEPAKTAAEAKAEARARAEHNALIDEYIGIVDKYAQESMRRDPEFRVKHPKLYEMMKKQGILK